MESFNQRQIDAQPRQNRSGWRKLVVAILLALIAAFAGNWLAGSATAPFGDTQSNRYLSWLDAVRDVAIARIGESPDLPANPTEGPLLLCDGISQLQERALGEGIALMRATESGVALYDLLELEGVCIGIEELPYNSAYAAARWSPANGWAESQIRIDGSYVTVLYPDVLAAILIHEATHIERAIDRTACYYADACSMLPNGVNLEEEMVAHSAEAEWWIEIYGRDGKEWAFGSDHAENQLKAAYLRGPAEFRAFVEQARSDYREGEGI